MKPIELHPFVFLYLVRTYMHSKTIDIENYSSLRTSSETEKLTNEFNSWLKKFHNPTFAITELLSDKVREISFNTEFETLLIEAKKLGYRLVKE